MPNQILVIRPYRLHGTWVFDDPAVGLVQEPFVCGIPEMIDDLVREIPRADAGFRLLFSGGPFPGMQKQLDRVREEHGGWWYRDRSTEREGWLCPALFRYFEQAPGRLHVRAEPVLP
jgi:hypothetical protein